MYSMSNVSAVPRWAKRVITWNFSRKDIEAESSGRTPKDGGPGHQLLSPSRERTSSRLGFAPYRSIGRALLPAADERVHATVKTARSAMTAMKRIVLVKLQDRHERVLGNLDRTHAL